MAQRRRLEDVSVAAALAMGLVENEQAARTRITNLPRVAIVRKSSSYRSSARHDRREPVDVVTQMISRGLPRRTDVAADELFRVIDAAHKVASVLYPRAAGAITRRLL
jgi:2-methylaconitate cis-trans-isomerase PrpF